MIVFFYFFFFFWLLINACAVYWYKCLLHCSCHPVGMHCIYWKHHVMASYSTLECNHVWFEIWKLLRDCFVSSDTFLSCTTFVLDVLLWWNLTWFFCWCQWLRFAKKHARCFVLLIIWINYLKMSEIWNC